MVKSNKRELKSFLISRPPVVCVLGHVDHGKTTLLDYIRKTHVAAAETGGITQHIGAYQIKLKSQGKTITFIDTPGHAAFNKIRCRGVKVADLAVLVVDASEGVKPQTLESLQILEEAKIPFIVAANKIDLPGTSVDKVKAQLAERGVLVEGYGGQVVLVPISAKTGKGVDELLEMIILQAEIQELKAELNVQPEAVVIETKLDCRRGPLATVIVKKGVIHLGDFIVSGSGGKVKSMLDENGYLVSEAEPAKPVEILGFKELPEVGSLIKFSNSMIINRKKVTFTHKKLKPVIEEIKEKNKCFKLILKADVNGSLEAIKSSLPQEVVLISEGLGDVSESDVLMAASAKASILAFRVNFPQAVKKLAEFEKVNVKTYQVIYQLLEDIEKEVLHLIEPTVEETILGEATVIAEFKIKGAHIAGCRVVKGSLNLGDQVRFKRTENFIGEAKIKNMQKNRQDVKTVKAGDEVGLVFVPDVDFKIGDDIISFHKVIYE